MEETHVVTCFVEHDERVLVLKRSGEVGSYQQRWAGVSGYIEPGHTPLQQAWEELAEEIGLDESDVVLIKEGQPLEVKDEQLEKKWVVHPFRFRLHEVKKIRTDWEHTDYRWIHPQEIKLLSTVPRLLEAWENVK